MYRNTKKAIIKILALYLGTTSIFLSLFFVFMYFKESRDIFLLNLQDVESIHRNISKSIYKNVKEHFTSLPSKLEIKDFLQNKYNYEIDELKSNNIQIFIDNLDATNLLYSNFEIPSNALDNINKRGIYIDDNISIIESNIFLEKSFSNIDKAHKRPANILILIQDKNYNPSDFFWMKIRIFAYWLCAMCLAGIIAFVLVRLFLSPLQNQIESLNSFIKDSTHEINTPLSIILMSVETLENSKIQKAQIPQIQRIKLASMRLSNLYSDLVAYNFPNSLNSSLQNISLDKLIKERIEYFKIFIEQKDIKVKLDLSPASILASQEKIIRLIDNLIQNAIKYNKKGGSIAIELKDKMLKIQDSGSGIESKNIDKIFDRYVRFDSAKGGFGIGLSLVASIAKEYNINIQCLSSTKTRASGTTFILSW